MYDTVAALETARKLAGADARAADDHELLAAAVDLEGLVSLALAAQGQVLAELHTRGTTDTDFGLHTSTWVAAKTHIPRAVASEHLKVGDKLRRLLPVVAQALADERIGWWHAKALADAANPRVADALA